MPFEKNGGSDGLPQCDDCASSTLFVSVYLLFNIGYNLLIILILKFGSSNVLWLAMTVMVPLGNAAFYIPGIPGHTNPSPFDLAGLILIMLGLCGYRFAAKCQTVCCDGGNGGGGETDEDVYSALGGRSDRPWSERSRQKSRAASFFDNDFEQVGLAVAGAVSASTASRCCRLSCIRRPNVIRPSTVGGAGADPLWVLAEAWRERGGDRQLNRR